MNHQHQDRLHMIQALHLAALGLYTTHPNPRVGCVLVRDGERVGEGFHRKAGEPHAEPNALAQAGTRARGATAYVTLEPCCHHGRTPPCTEGLIEAGVARVVVAMRDPNPLVAGNGLARLGEAGIQVQEGLLETQARAINPGFVKRMQFGKPYVRCKLAMSLDGRTAMASGESKWITSDAARRDVQRLRARSDAILTGIGTVLADDPCMNVRLQAEALAGLESDFELPQPLRVVLDSRLRMPPEASMLSLPGKTLVICAESDSDKRQALETAGARVQRLAGLKGRPDLDAVLRYLAQQQINEVLLETGPVLAGNAMGQGLIDELIIYMAPHLMGSGARGLFHLPELERMQQRIPLEITDIRAIGSDWRITARPGNSAGRAGAADQTETPINNRSF